MKDNEETFNLLAIFFAGVGLIALLLGNVLTAGILGILGAISFTISLKYKEIYEDYESLSAESNA
ncbi:MAG: hypothetical protein ACE5K4_08105 [Candidatus Hydrothermarchaeota archaeon]